MWGLVCDGLHVQGEASRSTVASDWLYPRGMSPASGTSRLLLAWMTLVPLLAGCRSAPATDVSISSRSSLLAVDVLFPEPLSRDPSLVQAFFVKGPIHGGMEELPELVPATFVKWSRAYLLDPEPGTYSLVAVTAAFAPPWNDDPVAGVTKTRWSGTNADAMIFPTELINRTRTTIGPGRVAFMGALRIRRGDYINAETKFPDYLQGRLAELVRPGVTSESGLAAWLKRTRMVDLEETSLSNEGSDRKSFSDAALADLGSSPWAKVIERDAPREATAEMAMPSTPAPRPKRPAPIPDPVAAVPQSAISNPEAVVPESQAAAPEPAVAIPEPEPAASPPTPKRQRFAGIPPGSPLAEIELGMSRDEVRRILGPPDERINRVTAKAWIPFYNGRGAYLRDWIYAGEGRVVFSLHDGSIEVLDVVHGAGEGR